MQFYSEQYTMLELFPTQQKPHARVRLLLKQGKNSVCETEGAGEVASESACVWRVCLPVQPHTEYEVCTEACEIGFVYLCGGAQETAQGIRVLWPAAETGAAIANEEHGLAVETGAPTANGVVADAGRCFACETGAFVADAERGFAAEIDALAADAPYLGYDENPYREQYHFTPPTGWLNDPNGLCYHGGQYHLYYQFYPHAQQWGNMHWGHATSTDLVHWLHRPVFLTPQQELLEDETLAGGAFSGSAVTDGDSLRFFLTRHTAPRACEADMIETQVMLQSPDGFAHGEEVTVIAQREPSHSYHFRDPKVFVHADEQFMVLGSCVDDVPAVVLYAARDWTKWEYRGAVHLVDKAANEQGCESVECPDLFPLDGAWVCLAAHMNRTDEQNRKNPVHYAIGAWNGGALQTQSEGLLDFGGSFYAVQTFEHAGRRIAIGWIADFYAEHCERPGGVCGSMTLPRELHLRGGRLVQTPVREVYALLGQVLHESDYDRFCSQQNDASGVANAPLHVSVEGNCYYAVITLPEAALFECILARDGRDGNNGRDGNDGHETLTLTSDGKEIALISSRLPERRFGVTCESVKKVEIFFDRRTAEVFVNDGEAAGVKTFYSESLCGGFTFAAQGKAHVQVRAVAGAIPQGWRR